MITENQDGRDGDEKVVEIALSGGQFGFQQHQQSSVVIENGSFHGVELVNRVKGSSMENN